MVAYVQSPTSGVSTGTTVTTGSATWTTGNIVIVGFHPSNGSIAVNTMTSSGGTIRWFTHPSAVSNASPGLETWIGFIDSGFTGTITGNLSGSTNSVLTASEYSGVTSIGIGARSTPAATANPSQSLAAFTGSGAPWTVCNFTCNNNTNPTSNVGNLRTAGNQTNVAGAMVDNTTVTCSVTHASATWAIGIIELYDGGIDYGNGAYSFGGAGGGTNGYLGGGYQNFYYGARFTTGSNPAGYRLASLACFTSNTGSNSANYRGAVYDNDADPGKDLVADTGSFAFGTAGGSGSANLHIGAAAGQTLDPNTDYYVVFNTDHTTTGYRADDINATYTGATSYYTATTFGAPPNPWGTTSTEASGGHMWVHVDAIPAAGDANARLLGGDLLQSILFGWSVN